MTRAPICGTIPIRRPQLTPLPVEQHLPGIPAKKYTGARHLPDYDVALKESSILLPLPPQKKVTNQSGGGKIITSYPRKASRGKPFLIREIEGYLTDELRAAEESNGCPLEEGCRSRFVALFLLNSYLRSRRSNQ